MYKSHLFPQNISLIRNVCSFLLSKNDKNSVEYMAMCEIFSKVRDNSVTLSYNIFKDFFHKNYPENKNFRPFLFNEKLRYYRYGQIPGPETTKLKYFNYSFREKK